MDYIIIDNRMRNKEKNMLKYLGYKLVPLKKSVFVYPEISSHTDIFAIKIGDTLVCEKNTYEDMEFMLKNSEFNIVSGKEEVGPQYPQDVKYNVCLFGRYAVHNFKYTDSKVLKMLKDLKYEMINVEQGYSNCSIAVIDDSSVITTDKKIAEKLIANNISVLLLDYMPDIKLLDEYGNYSSMNGFIGGAMGKVDNNVIIFGDLCKIDRENRIREFIESRNLKIIEFEGLDVIDYGGLIEL